jgi:hypothetical protein
VTQLKAAKEALAAAITFRAALLRMRAVIGNPGATARTCELRAEELLGERFQGEMVSDEALGALSKAITKQDSMIDKIQVTLGDRTMQTREIYRVIVESGVEEYSTLRHFVNSLISKHTGGRGRGLFTKVRHGWYRNRKPGDAEGSIKLPKGFLVRAAYDVMGKGEVLSPKQVSERIMQSGKMLPHQCEATRIQSVLSNHSVRGLKCFERVDQSKYRRREGHTPRIENPVATTVDALCTILRNGPLSFAELCEKFEERDPHTIITRAQLKSVMLGNKGFHGRDVFEQVTPRVWRLKDPDTLEQIMKIMGSGAALSPYQVASHLSDIGKTIPLATIQATMAKHCGIGLPLRRVREGLYTKNHDKGSP